MSPKQFSVTITVDEHALKQAYSQGHDIPLDDCPDIDSMLHSELNWLSHSGISFSQIQHKQTVEGSIFVEWSIDDVRQRALEHDLNLDDEQCQEVLEHLENNYDANYGISWNTLDAAINF